MKRIIVERRTSDVMVFLDGNRTIWGRGSSQAEAIGDMIYTHQRKFDVIIEIGE